MELNLSADELLSTTRAARKRLDLERGVPLDLIRECISLAIQAPTGTNSQGWHWMVVTDPEKRRALGKLYRRGWQEYTARPEFVGNTVTGDTAFDAQMQRVVSSGEYLAEKMGEVPVLLVPCVEGRADNVPTVRSASHWGSLLPAVWSFCLAARSRGLGTSWTTLHLMYEVEAANILGIPYERISQGALVPVAYTKGTEFKPARRSNLEQIVHFDTW
ncbi:nitroreductase family protein [Gordonia sp. (in: high G+C Gram-positive bacteria)]|uniref:nitroreductase family protein n=1 Tax=Gordonia sp. (in: high G+C Gram-positive bacteria) TaxID=84139 RepID=UPI003F9E40AC